MLKTQRDKLDDIFSLFIRTRDDWTCQKCGMVFVPPTRALHNSHFYGRGSMSTRWDPQNCIALCFGCHHYSEVGKNGRQEYELYMKNLLGKRGFDALTLRANQIRKWTPWELNQLFQDLRKDLEAMREGVYA